jgi:hypothetical protein
MRLAAYLVFVVALFLLLVLVTKHPVADALFAVGVGVVTGLASRYWPRHG